MLSITWLGHATFELTLPGGEVIIVDPWVDGNPKYPPNHKIKRADMILVTHGHGDHTANVMQLAKEFGAPVIAIHEISEWLTGKGVKDCRGMGKGGTQRVGAVAVTMTHAVHSSSIDTDGQVIYAGEAAGFVLTFADGRAVYFAGDTTVFSDMALIAELYKPELAFLPIGDHYTMGPREAAMACRLLNVKKVFPMHWGTFPVLTGTPQKLVELLAGTGVSVIEAEPGQAVAW